MSINRFTKCDQCDDAERDVIIELVTTRPSDPSSLCCVLTGCPTCLPDHDVSAPLDPDRVPGMGTYEQLDSWVNDHGGRNRISFYE